MSGIASALAGEGCKADLHSYSPTPSTLHRIPCRVKGKLGAQQAFFIRKLKLQGSMGLAMKLQPILDAANEPSAKL